jgi:hypothetical protein
MVQQMSLASCEYPKGVNEFLKAGFTQLASELIRPFRVKESPVQYECKVRQIIETGDGPGAGNLVICDILLIHISEDVLDEKNEIDQGKIDLVGRMGGDFYVRTNEMARFIVPKPVANTGIGIDALPEAIKFNPYLSGNDLGQLGNLEAFPVENQLIDFKLNIEMKKLYQNQPQVFFDQVKKTLSENKPFDALCMLLSQL